ncbi:MAG: bacteriohemerythrin [Candidatus Zixiibacteriota bacterium]
MALYTWSNYMSVGDEKMDAQHKKLFRLVNELFEVIREDKGKQYTGKIIDELLDYTVTHFRAEEHLLDERNYPKLEEQRESHKIFVDAITNFKHDLAIGKKTLNMELISFLSDWLVEHIMKMDKEYSQVIV